MAADILHRWDLYSKYSKLQKRGIVHLNFPYIKLRIRTNQHQDAYFPTLQ